MSKDYVKKTAQAAEETDYASSFIPPRVQSRIVPRVTSRIQPKFLMGRKNATNELNTDPSLEKEADDLGKRASEGKSANVLLSAEPSIQKKDKDAKNVDKGASEHAKGVFDRSANSYTVPETSVYTDATKAFDTLYSIAKRFGVSIEEIKSANRLETEALVPGQVLIIPFSSVGKEERQPMKLTPPKESKMPSTNLVNEKKDEAEELISRHTHYFMLDESGLAKNLVATYVFNNISVVSKVLSEISDHNRDDLSLAILNLLPLPQWNRIDKKLLKEFYNHLNSGFVSAEEKTTIIQLEEVLHPSKEKPVEAKRQKVDTKTVTDTSIVSFGSNISGKEEPYASQMDNTFSKYNIYGKTGPQKLVTNYNTCNVTALAMALRRVEKEQVLKNSVIGILISNGGYNEEQRSDLLNKDLEDLIMYRFEQAGTGYFLEPFRKYSANPKFNFSTEDGAAPHQFAFCLNLIGGDILDLKINIVNTKAITRNEYYKEVKSFFDKGYGAFMGTKLTTGGHVVSLESIKEEGILINDPYGLFATKQGEYIVNGSKLTTKSRKIILDNPNNISKKLTYNQEINNLLKEACENQKSDIILPHTLGARNFYTWQQVAKYEIGWWISLINKK